MKLLWVLITLPEVIIKGCQLLQAEVLGGAADETGHRQSYVNLPVARISEETAVDDGSSTYMSLNMPSAGEGMLFQCNL